MCAGRLADGGLSVTIVEDDLVGGECSFYAGMPSGALLRPAQAIAEAGRVAGAAQAVSGELDVSAVLARRDEVVHGLDDEEQVPCSTRAGSRCCEDAASSTGCSAYAMGSAAAIPSVDGLAEAEPWTNREVTTLSEIPASVLILGGGVVGCEMKHAISSLGAPVTLVEPGPGLLGREEPFAGELAEAALRRGGVDVRIATAARSEAGTAVAPGDGTTITAERVLVAAGRRPKTTELGPETVGL